MTRGRVLVTGGASGIGASVCDALRSEGYEAVPADRNASKTVVRLDVRDEASWER